MKRFIIFTALLLFYPKGHPQSHAYTLHRLSTCSVKLSVHLNIVKMYEDSSPDYSDYRVVTNDKEIDIQIHSLLKSRFNEGSINEMYISALDNTSLLISYQFLGLDYYVLSGLNKKSGNWVYLKRVCGQNFVSDLYIEYTDAKKGVTEQLIKTASLSFKSN